MAETNSFNISAAGLDDGTLDFYTLIQEPVDADMETIRGKISSLYNEAQANRDHRNLTKRREYQTLLELLPRARGALLDPEKRARYNAYLASAQNGGAEMEFEAFMSDLMGQSEVMEEKTGLLGVQDKEHAPRARVIKTPVESASPSRASVKVPASSSRVPTMAFIAAVIGALVGAMVGYFAMDGAVPAILLGFIGAALGFVLFNRQPRGGIRS